MWVYRIPRSEGGHDVECVLWFSMCKMMCVCVFSPRVLYHHHRKKKKRLAERNEKISSSSSLFEVCVCGSARTLLHVYTCVYTILITNRDWMGL